MNIRLSKMAAGVFALFFAAPVFNNVSFGQVRNVEGDIVRTEAVAMKGIEMADALSDDGRSIVKVAYVWFAGTGRADNKQVAIEMAQSEAYLAISREFQNAVITESENANLANNGEVQQALKSHWQQVSSTVLKGCGPFGNAEVQYSERTHMYTVRARIAIPGEAYNRMLEDAAATRPAGLSGSELDDFIDVNRKIIDAAKVEQPAYAE